MGVTTGILLFDGAEELDFAGPYEVFGAAAMMKPGDRVLTLSPSGQPIRAAKGLRVLPDHSIDDAPPLDVVMVPGGTGTRPLLKDAAVLDWLRRVAASARFTTSVCTGCLVLTAAGLAKGRRVTTYWNAFEELEALRGGAIPQRGVRFVADGSLATAAGVSAGIDLALWLVGQLHDPAFAREVQRYIEYFPEPPYAEGGASGARRA